MRLACLSLAITLACALPAHGASLTLERQAPDAAPQARMLYAPKATKPDGALTVLRFENNWDEKAAPGLVTIGAVFMQGAVQPAETLGLRLGDDVALAQLDPLALHEDGSVRHAAITLQAPALAAGKSADGMLLPIVGLRIADFDPAPALAGAFAAEIEVVFHDGDGPAQRVEIDLATLARERLAESPQLRLNGPLVKEFRIETELAAHLTLIADIRVYRDERIRTSIAFANHKSFAPGLRHMVYDVRIHAGDIVAFEARAIPHHRASNWRRVFWTGGQPKIFAAQPLNALIDTGAVLPLDPSLGIAAGDIAARAESLKTLPPLSPAFIERYFPKPGGRPDIGIYPQWTAQYLASGNEALRDIMLAHADAAGAVPWHFVDEATGAPVSIEDRPRFWADERGAASAYGADRPHPDIFRSSDGGWTIDHSHKPALTAVPYLITADRYYADELAMQGAYAIFGRWPDLRDGGLKAIDVEQVRASAWSLRDLSDAAWLLPDNHPSKEYLERALRENLRLAREKYIDQRHFARAGELEGFWEEMIESERERISPWQNDYVALSLQLAAKRGEGDAAALLSWMAPFLTGRVLSDDFNIADAASYIFPAKNALTQAPVSRWATLAEKMQRRNLSTPEARGDYPELGYGYSASAYAALAALASIAQTPKSWAAFARYAKHTRSDERWAISAPAGLRRHNQFAFTPILPSGAALARGAIRFNKSGDAHDNLIIGDASANNLDGGAGDDLILGGAGDDRLSGGAGQDVFSFYGAFGRDTLADFNPNEDRLFIAAGADQNLKDVITNSVDDARGVRLVFDGSSILLEGIRADALSPRNISIFE